MFWLFGHEACGILVLSPGIEPACPALEGEVSTTGPPGMSRHTQILNKKVLEYLLSDSCSPFLPVNGVWCVCVYWPNMLLKTSAVIQSWYIWPYLIITVLCVCGVWGHHCFILFSWEESHLPSASHLIFASLGSRSWKWLPLPPWAVAFSSSWLGRMELPPAGFPNWNVGFCELQKLLRYCVYLDTIQPVSLQAHSFDGIFPLPDIVR